jgi:hypothetical protein
MTSTNRSPSGEVTCLSSRISRFMRVTPATSESTEALTVGTETGGGSATALAMSKEESTHPWQRLERGENHRESSIVMHLNEG